MVIARGGWVLAGWGEGEAPVGERMRQISSQNKARAVVPITRGGIFLENGWPLQGRGKHHSKKNQEPTTNPFSRR